ncbi:hypothetical protein POV27_00190 [Aureisphaera galaxeae]|uniref:hypothetical protein n=1 Tax=Aureisphaera galaxeae TaxID=1538023 RepID=UPI0023507E84|nr:hypothetical protein [Aureisphaera galaxeae]MDC8002454.1 hypothetical protein [Aureisphaera galaxeae]
MKHSILYLLALVLLGMSCKQGQKQETTSTSEKTIFQDPPTPPTPLPCVSNYQIYDETAYLWIESWATYNNSLSENNNYTIETVPNISFSADSLKSLQDHDLEANGVLLFYIKNNVSDPIPSLAMVNTKDCVPQPNDCENGNCILASWYEGDQEFISEEKFNEYQRNWCKSADATVVFTPVYAFNYSWDAINDHLADGNGEGIDIKYGLRTIGPSDTAEFTEEASDTITGSVVYSNIIYGQGQNFNNIRAFDFAMPCPTYCGDRVYSCDN